MHDSQSQSTDETAFDAETPVCKFPASLRPAGFIRFAVTEADLAELYEAVEADYEAAVTAEADERPVEANVTMGRTAFEQFTNGVQQLVSNQPQAGVAQVLLTEDPDFTVTMLVGVGELKEMLREGQRTLTQSDGQDEYTQTFTARPNAALVFLRQVEAAFDGATDPVDAIDMDAIRASVQ